MQDPASCKVCKCFCFVAIKHPGEDGNLRSHQKKSLDVVKEQNWINLTCDLGAFFLDSVCQGTLRNLNAPTCVFGLGTKDCVD